MRPAALLLALIAAWPAAAEPAPSHEYVQAVEFPYYLYPRDLWERELVWLKAIGIRTVEFSVPPNWHQLQPNQYDFTGSTSPRRDLVGLVRILRKLNLSAWVRPLPPTPDWPSARLDPAAQKRWLQQLGQLLATQTVSHGGPVAFVEGGVLSIDAGVPPGPAVDVVATRPEALAASRAAIVAARGALLWRNVEDGLYPEGWAPDSSTFLRKGAVGLSGDERPSTGALRRDAALLRNWGPLLAVMRPAALPKPANGKLPEGVTVSEIASPVASAVSVSNRGSKPFEDELRVLDPALNRPLVIPNVAVPAGESLWLPLNVSLGPNGLCRECSNFSGAEHIVYATAELLSIEFENGILAMEFAAPRAGEVVLQLARKPVGPYLAAGKLSEEFEWDDKLLRTRLVIPAGKGSGHHVRVGIAIEEPETSAFFNEARRLVIGQKNVLSTTYSGESVAKRSRLKLPDGFTAVPIVKSPNEIDYEVTVPPDAIHGDWGNLALEADAMLLGRVRLQLFRPVSIRLMEAMQLHFGQETELTPDPPLASIEPRAGTSLEFSVRNNAPAIQTFRLEPSGDGLEFLPPKIEISVGAVDERRVPLRVFAKDGVDGLRNWNLHVSGGATLDLPMRALILPRGRTVAFTADLDGDGSPEWVLESQRVRAVFSSQDGGRWMELDWKDGNLNFLPEQGTLAGAGPVEVHAAGDALEFTARGWTRTVRLAGSVLTIEQSTPLPPDRLAPEKRGNVTFSIDRASPSSAVYRLN
jgi:Glycosyl hydrolases family 35